MALLTSPAAADLLVNVRNMLNQPDATSSFWTDDELMVYINEGIRRYFTEVVQHANGEFNTTAVLNIVSGAELVALPQDFFQVRACYRKVTNGYQIMQFKNNLTDGYTTDGSGGQWYVPYYYLRDNSLVLRPVPNFNETGALLLEYVYFPDTILTGGDTLTADVSPVFRDMIETYAVYKAKVKESSVNGTNTTGVIKDNLNDLYTSFRDCMSKRAINPTFVQAYNPEDMS